MVNDVEIDRHLALRFSTASSIRISLVSRVVVTYGASHDSKSMRTLRVVLVHLLGFGDL